MSRNHSFLEDLLYQDESSTLDFKREQYRCTINEERGELIKDILAFTNAWRHTDAYILIGVAENHGRRAQVVGVTRHLKDADLQQLVNSKTDQPIDFSYRSERFDGKDIGILHIPVQNRPRFLTKPFGKLRADTVYVRRGSSTAIARPDEVAQMGTAHNLQLSPNLRVQFANRGERILRGDSLELHSTVIENIDEPSIPDSVSNPLRLGSINVNYFRDLVSYQWANVLCQPVQFAITNSGSVPAKDVRIEFGVDFPQVVLFDEYGWPKRPRIDWNTGFLPRLDLLRTRDTDKDSDKIVVETLTDGKRIIQIRTSKVQPKQITWIDSLLFLGAKSSGVVPLDGTIWLTISLHHRQPISKCTLLQRVAR